MRKIIHIDADCFYAAVERLDNPRLVGKAIAVGGEPSRRGVIATCSYEARRLGVRSAMPSAQALRLCPELIILPPNMARYKRASSDMREIFAEYTDAVEPLSLDEAYLDVSASKQCRGSATWIAREVQARIGREVGVPVSAGVASVKFLAKIASDWHKPNGFFSVLPEQVDTFTAQLRVGAIPGVGAVTVARMQRFGLYTCDDVRRFGLPAMIQNFGALGQQVFQYAWGRDGREVRAERVRKSVSVERTYAEDKGAEELNNLVPELLQQLERRFLAIAGVYRPHRYFVKVKFCDFSQTTLEAPLPAARAWPSVHGVCKLLHGAWHRMRKPVRLVGLGMRLRQDNDGTMHQLPLF